MNSKSVKVLIVGCGSIGERHLRVFQQIEGVDAVPCESNTERLRTIVATYACREYYKNLEAVNLQHFDGLVICTSPSTHIPIALAAAQAGVNLLIEKPLSNTMDKSDELLKLAREKKLVVAVGYVLRFHPGVERVKEWLENRVIGKILAARMKVGQHFPTIRPDYRQIYFAKKEEGGGILLDASHELDLILWFLGQPKEVVCFYDKLSDMEIDTADIAEMLIRFKNRAIAEIHLNCFQRDDSRNFELIGSEGTIVCNYTGRVGYYHHDTKQWRWDQFAFERDDLFLKQARNFIHSIEGSAVVRVPLEQARATLAFCLAAKAAADTRKVVMVSD